MDTTNQMETNSEKNYNHRPGAGRILGGFVVVGIGIVLLLEKLGYFFPGWLFSWKMLLIAIGIYVGARHLFRGFGWLIPIIIGGAFLLDDFFPGFAIRPFLWPLIIVIIGLIMIFRPRHHSRWHRKFNRHRHKWEQHKDYWDSYAEGKGTDDAGDRLESVIVFGGTKKNIISKDFKGGEFVCVFGGAELNLLQADINGKVRLEITQVFGGTKLIIPPHWQVQSAETVTFMGNIEDRRPQNVTIDTSKVLVITGSSVFGAIHISSY